MRAAILFVAVLCTLTLPATAQVPSSRTPEALAQQGNAAMEAGRYRDAFDAYAAAAQLRPRDPSLYVGAAQAATLLGQLADAQRWLERAVQIQPRYTPASVLLGQVLFRLGKVQDAVTVYEAALRYAPQDAELTSKLAQWKKDADLQSRFFERRGAHFSVLFEGAADDAIASKVVTILEEAYYRIGTALMTYPSETITVVLYTSQQFQDVTQSPAWAGAVYDGRIKLPVAGALNREAELRRVAEHEFVHAVVGTMAGRAVPTWLHEGLAMALQDGNGGGAERVLATTSTRIPLSKLASGFIGLNEAQATLAYAESLHAVKQIIAQRGMPSLVSLLHSLGRGSDFESAFEQATFIRFRDFEGELLRK